MVVEYINSNPYFIALLMFTMNVGGRFLQLEIPPYFERIFQKPLARKFLLFAVFFMASRDIRIALLLTIVASIVFHFILREGTIYSVVRQEEKKKEENKKKEDVGKKEKDIKIVEENIYHMHV